MMKRIIVVILSAALCCAPLCSCGGTFAFIDDYPGYLSSLYQYYFDEPDSDLDSPSGGEEGDISGGTGNQGGSGSQSGDEQPDVPSLPQIIPAEEYDGLVTFGDGKFDIATNFFGRHAYVSRNGKDYLLDTEGNLTEIPESDDENDNTMSDIVPVKIANDKLILQNKEGKLGVIDIYGKMLADIEYDWAETAPNTVLVRSGQDYFVRCGYGELRSLNGVKSAMILSDEYLFCDGAAVSTDTLEVVKIGDYVVEDAPIDGVVRIHDASGSIGYASLEDREVFIEPTYLFGGVMSEGVAAVNERCKIDFVHQKYYAHPKLVDRNGCVLFDFESLYADTSPSDITVFPCHDGYNVYRVKAPTPIYGAVRTDGDEATCVSLPYELKDELIHGDYCIVMGTERIYSLESGALTDTDTVSTDVVCGRFIVKRSDGSYALLGRDLAPIVEDCDSIEYYEDTVLIRKNGAYAYYRFPD